MNKIKNEVHQVVGEEKLIFLSSVENLSINKGFFSFSFSTFYDENIWRPIVENKVWEAMSQVKGHQYFCIVPYSKYFRLCGLPDFYGNWSPLLLQ